MKCTRRLNRRDFVTIASATGAGVILSGRAQTAWPSEENGRSHEVTPAEDLMFEHGVIERLLLIYEEAVRRIESDQQVPAKAIRDAAELIRDFSEKYHEKLEEQYVFPRLEQAREHVELTRILRRQHIVGHEISANLLAMSETKMVAEPKRVAESLRSFSRMYFAHIASENSVAFRTFHGLVSPEQYMELGEQFEGREDLALGEGGFHKIVTQVSDIEKRLGIYYLDTYTAKMES